MRLDAILVRDFPARIEKYIVLGCFQEYIRKYQITSKIRKIEPTTTCTHPINGVIYLETLLIDFIVLSSDKRIFSSEFFVRNRVLLRHVS